MRLNQPEGDNFFDNLGFQDPEETKRILAQQKVKGDKLDQLIHRTFSTDSGQELLKIWAETLILMPTAQAGMDSIEIGINEGVKTFLRNLLLTMKKAEEG